MSNTDSNDEKLDKLLAEIEKDSEESNSPIIKKQIERAKIESSDDIDEDYSDVASDKIEDKMYFD